VTEDRETTNLEAARHLAGLHSGPPDDPPGPEADDLALVADDYRRALADVRAGRLRLDPEIAAALRGHPQEDT
jgi:hypothetical protein